MSEFSMNAEPNMVVKARFLERGSGLALNAKEYSVRLYDKDLFEDDFLGESVPDENGTVTISFSHDAFAGDTIIAETLPDFFFVIFKNAVPVSHTKVLQDIPLENLTTFKMGKGEEVDLGTYLIEVKD